MRTSRAKIVVRALVTGATSVVFLQLMSLNVSLNSRLGYPSIDFKSEALAEASPIQSILRYAPPDRGSPRRTQGTGSRGGTLYAAPNRGAPVRTQGTGSRGDYSAPDRGAPVRTQGTGSRGDYSAPDRGAPARTQGTGSRGGSELEPLTLTLLIPNDHTGRTTSSHPTFYWYMSAESFVPMEFALVEPGKTEPVFVYTIDTPKAGMMQVEMPKELPGLVAGRKYRWSVTLVRNSKRRSNDVFVQGWIERVATTPKLTEQLAAATSERERATAYASAGLWYDSLKSISLAYAQAPNDKAIMQERLSLLEQAGQTQVVQQERQRLAQKED